jgi:hypothetical protein
MKGERSDPYLVTLQNLTIKLAKETSHKTIVTPKNTDLPLRTKIVL